MKKSVSFMLLFFVCAGCFSVNRSAPSVDQTTVLAIEVAAFSGGQMIAEKKPEIIAPILDFYKHVNPEDITVNELNKGMHSLKSMDVHPVYINLILRLADQIGMTVDFNDKKIVDIRAMNTKYFAVALEAFMNGVALKTKHCGD